MGNDELMQKDLARIWHPCTQMKDHEFLPLIPIKSASGVYLYDFDGNRYIDAISSWWVNLFGHANPRIGDKIKKQLDLLEHVIFAGFTHEPIIKLSERLVEITPKGLNKCFYADNGSSAIEVALKMSFHYHKNQGKIRPFFVSLTNSYHGETMGALSVGDVALYRDAYRELLLRSYQTPAPVDESEDEALRAALALEELFKEKGKEISAFIIEPLVQCAGGMRIHHPLFVSEARRLCTLYDVHFIADEIAVGFGRTGTMFACEQSDVSPDFMVLSKGLTGGYLPLSVVMTTEEIYQAFYCDYSEHRAFLHSHSYTGNPLACVAANATLDIFEEDQVIDTNKKKADHIATALEKFKELVNVKAVRQKGMIAAVELKDYDPAKRMGLRVYRHGLENGVLLRPLGNIVYFMPPYVITPGEIDIMMNVAFEGIKKFEKETI